VKSYVFQVELVREDDGRWSAGVPSLPGCATWGNTKEEALQNLHDGVELYIRDIQETGGEIPKNAAVQITEAPVVAITI